MRLLRRFAARRDSPKGRVLRRLVPLGDNLKVWLVVSPPLALLPGGRGRRAALLGWEAVAVATVLGKAVEVMVRRRRPGSGEMRDRGVAGSEPSSSSFPSSHTASAVAFAGAAGIACPPATWVLGPLAGLVAWSRPAGGRHYPSDVAGGIVTGAAAVGIVHELARRQLPYVSALRSWSGALRG